MALIFLQNRELNTSLELKISQANCLKHSLNGYQGYILQILLKPKGYKRENVKIEI
jgi:hypothetical protein